MAPDAAQDVGSAGIQQAERYVVLSNEGNDDGDGDADASTLATSFQDAFALHGVQDLETQLHCVVELGTILEEEINRRQAMAASAACTVLAEAPHQRCAVVLVAAAVLTMFRRFRRTAASPRWIWAVTAVSLRFQLDRPFDPLGRSSVLQSARMQPMLLLWAERHKCDKERFPQPSQNVDGEEAAAATLAEEVDYARPSDVSGAEYQDVDTEVMARKRRARGRRGGSRYSQGTARLLDHGCVGPSGDSRSK